MNTSPETATRRDFWVSAVLLCLVTPFMAEVLSANGTPWGFVINSCGLVVVYGFPILLLREWALRRGVSLVGLLIAGFGYGFYNEGLLAKTILFNKKVPWDIFDGRIGWGGVNWGWLLVICAYHALFSIVTPLLLMEKLRPHTAGRTWLSKRSASALLLTIAVVSLIYFPHKPITLPVGFFLLWGSIGLSVAIGSVFRREWEPSVQPISERALAWWGATFLPSLLLLSVAFSHGLLWPAFAVGWAGIALFAARNALRGGAGGTLSMGLGAYAGMSGMNVIFGNPVAKVVGVLALVAIVIYLRQNRGLLDTTFDRAAT